MSTISRTKPPELVTRSFGALGEGGGVGLMP